MSESDDNSSDYWAATPLEYECVWITIPELSPHNICQYSHYGGAFVASRLKLLIVKW